LDTLRLVAPFDGYVLEDPETKKKHVIKMEDPGPPQFRTFEFDLALDFDFCATCRKAPEHLFACADCLLVSYCDVNCQRAGRKTHKAACKRKQKVDEWRTSFQ
jgi:hypothetical protein